MVDDSFHLLKPCAAPFLAEREILLNRLESPPSLLELSQFPNANEIYQQNAVNYHLSGKTAKV